MFLHSAKLFINNKHKFSSVYIKVKNIEKLRIQLILIFGNLIVDPF